MQTLFAAHKAAVIHGFLAQGTSEPVEHPAQRQTIPLIHGTAVHSLKKLQQW